MTRFPHLAQRLFNRPQLLRPERMEVMLAALLDQMGIVKLNKVDGTAMGVVEMKQMAWDEEDDRPSRRFYELKDGIACIPVDGTLVHKLGGINPWSGMIGYDQLDKKLTMAREDKDVRAVLFDGDTPGGETSGCFEFAKKIYAGSARFGGKPVFWLCNEQTASAGYALASACDRIAIPETGITGSIGVWTMLVDLTKRLALDGIEVTIRRAGDRKARGHSLEGWDDELLDKIDAWLEDTRLMFANLVAMGRGIAPAAVLDQEGDWFPAEEALSLGLVDAIASPDDVFDLLRDEVARLQ